MEKRRTAVGMGLWRKTARAPYLDDMANKGALRAEQE
jgi:hypothetical protein